MNTISEKLADNIFKNIGRIEKSELLSGQGAGRAFKVEISGSSYVLKQSPKDMERLFYQEISSKLNSHGVHTPKLFADGDLDGLDWILIEYIPKELPKERWMDDEEVISTIAKVHQIDIREKFLERNSHKHSWDENLIDQAIELWDESDRKWLRPLFEEIKDMYNEQFSREYFVSGDPNGRNWGIRENGELVLFDWERVGYSDPATDLMGIAFGEPEQDIFDNIAKLYLKHNNSYYSSVEYLARKIQIGRVHITLAITKDLLLNESHIEDWVADYHREKFPIWLKEIFL